MEGLAKDALAGRSGKAPFRWLLLGLLVAYTVTIYTGTLRPFNFRWDARAVSQYFPTPEWIPFTLWDERVGLRGYLEDKLVNGIMFVPFGAAIALLIPARRRGLVGLSTLFAFLCSLSIETLQYFIPERHSMASDVVMNTVGGFLGAWLAAFCRDAIRKAEAS